MNWLVSLPLIIFYLTLLINTFFSVKFFAGIVKRFDIMNIFIDISLVFIYGLLALALKDQKMFLALACLMFAVATLKYVSMLVQKRYAIYSKTLRRKIILDITGFFYSVLFYFLIPYLSLATAVWIWTIGFVIANVYLLKIKPFYAFTDEESRFLQN